MLHDWRDEFAGEAACAGMLQENDIQLDCVITEQGTVL